MLDGLVLQALEAVRVVGARELRKYDYIRKRLLGELNLLLHAMGGSGADRPGPK